MLIPQEVMPEVCWSFAGARFNDRVAFEAELQQYQEDILGIKGWNPREVVVSAPQLRIRYECWDEDEDEDEELGQIITLTAENGKTFSSGELMFSLHNAVVEQLSELDHHFFEGLELADEQEDELPPLYELQLGS